MEDSKYRERLKEERKLRRLSQQAVAEMLNVRQRTYSDYESGRLRLPLDKLVALSEMYNCSVDYMCGVTDKRKKFPKQ